LKATYQDAVHHIEVGPAEEEAQKALCFGFEFFSIQVISARTLMREGVGAFEM